MRDIQTAMRTPAPLRDPAPARPACAPQHYTRAVAHALRQDFQSAPHGVKRIMACTHASERTVKYWLSGATAPSGVHLISLAARSDAVFAAVLHLSGRSGPCHGGDITQFRRLVSNVLRDLDRMIPEPDCPIF